MKMGVFKIENRELRKTGSISYFNMLLLTGNIQVSTGRIT